MGQIKVESETLLSLGERISQISSNINGECYNIQNEANKLKERINTCLNEARSERIRRELELEEAQRRQDELASAGGETILSLATGLAAAAMTAEIVAREAALAKAVYKENQLIKINDEFEDEVSPKINLQTKINQDIQMDVAGSYTVLSQLAEIVERDEKVQWLNTNYGYSSFRVSGGIIATDDLNYSQGRQPKHIEKIEGSNCSFAFQESGTSLTQNQTENRVENRLPRIYYGVDKQSCLSTTHESIDGIDVKTIGINSDTTNKLISIQGTNTLGYEGCCALSTIANINKILGRTVEENQVVNLASSLGICDTSYSGKENKFNGGMNDEGITRMLSGIYGVETRIEKNSNLSIDELGNYIKSGHIVTVGLDAGALWKNGVDKPTGKANHQVLLTKVSYDNNGNIVGFYMADTGRGLSTGNNVFVNKEDFISSFFESVFGDRIKDATAIISLEPLLQEEK